MKFIIILLPFIFLAQEAELKILFEQAVTNPISCDSLILYCEKNNQTISKAYLGAALILQAKHKKNPYHKWKSFQRGKTQLEETIKKHPKNTKIRAIRYYIQNNIPKFLNYNSNKKEDEEWIKKYGSKSLNKEIELFKKKLDEYNN